MNKLLNNNKLFGYKDFFHFDEMIKTKKLPKILLSGAKGIGKYTFSLHFINYILSKNGQRCMIVKILN